MRKALTVLAAIAVVGTTPASAAVNIVVEGGGTPVVFEGADGNRFGLVGLDARRRDGNAIVDLPDVTVDRNDIISRLSNPNSFVDAYFCENFSSGGSCTPFTSIVVQDEARLFNSLLLEFNSTGSITFNNPVGGTGSLGLGTVTRSGPPPIGTAVPEPGTWLMVMLGLFGIGALLRRQPKLGLRSRPVVA
jgi:hypothetical protein